MNIFIKALNDMFKINTLKKNVLNSNLTSAEEAIISLNVSHLNR